MPRSRLRLIVGLFLGVTAVALATLATERQSGVGIVLLHGKQGTVPGPVGPLAQKLKAAGYLVATPEMPWSRARIYGASYEDAMLEIDKAADGLRSKGARKILVGGLSLGGNAAVGYAARRENLAGIIVLAPGHFPESERLRVLCASSVARARKTVTAGQGDSFESFTDFNMGQTFFCRTSAKIYLSYFDPDGPAVIPKNAAAIRSALPILWVVGSADPATRPSDYAFDRAPPHSKSRYLTVDAGHVEVPAAAADQVVTWLQSLDL